MKKIFVMSLIIISFNILIAGTSLATKRGTNSPGVVTVTGGGPPSCIWVQVQAGYENQGCLSLATVVCSVVGGNTIYTRAACIASAYATCYVPPVYACQYYS